MKKAALLCLLLTLTFLARAETLRDEIHSLELGDGGEEHLLLLRNGRVVFIAADEAKAFVESELKPGDRVEVVVDKHSSLKAISSLPPEKEEDWEEDSPEGPALGEPTVFSSYAEAKALFAQMNRTYKSSSECTDRAHIWAWEEWKKHGLVSKKVFLFFTRTYIRRYRYHWWFHASPFTYISENGGVVEHVLDRRYTSYPHHMKPWTDIFIRSKKSCPVTTYRYYRTHKYGEEHCFLVKVPMYYRLPYHVRMLEDYGRTKSSFSTSEVNFSYRAFRRRGAKATEN